jgi:hypothetical protein
MYEHPGAERRLFDGHDHALVGTVTAVRPAGSGAHGPHDVVVDVMAAFNRPTTTALVTLTMPDAGQMSGYPFQVGRAYFMPVRDGRVGLCSPITPLEAVDRDPARALAALTAAAREGGVAVAVPPAAATPAASPAPPAAAVPAAAGRPSTPGPSALVAGVSVVALGGLAAGVAVRRSRRRGTAGDDAAGSGPATAA